MEIFHDSNGVKYNGDSISLSLDPKIAHDGINFTSHAHMDHLPSARSSGTVLCTYETVEIAKIRNRDIQNNIQHYESQWICCPSNILHMVCALPTSYPINMTGIISSTFQILLCLPFLQLHQWVGI